MFVITVAVIVNLVLSCDFIGFFIVRYVDFLRSGGKFIVPHPDLRVGDRSGSLVIGAHVLG